VATFTLSGEINELTGVDATRVTVVKVRASRQLFSPTGAAYAQEITVPVIGGAFSVLLPSDATPTPYTFTVIAEQIGMVWAGIPKGATSATVDLGDATS
jgi:hypothetical protein